MTHPYFEPSAALLDGLARLKSGTPWDFGRSWMADLQAAGFGEGEQSSGGAARAAEFVQVLSVDGVELAMAYLARDASARLSQASLAWLTQPVESSSLLSGAVDQTVAALASAWGPAYATLDQTAAWTAGGRPDDEVVAAACWTPQRTPAIGPVAAPTAYRSAMQALTAPLSVTFTPLRDDDGRWSLQVLLVA